MLDKEAAHLIAHEVVGDCKREMDNKIDEVRRIAEKNNLSDEKIKQIAQIAAEVAVERITEDFYMGVGKKTVLVIGATVVVTWDQLREGIKRALGL